MKQGEVSQELAEISDQRVRLLEALEGYKSSRDSALIKKARRELRNLSKRRAGLLEKIRKEKRNEGLFHRERAGQALRRESKNDLSEAMVQRDTGL